jgi:alpha-glucosidase
VGGIHTTMPFDRMLAGHADYTPVVFGARRKETSWAHQIATAVVLTSPLLVPADVRRHCWRLRRLTSSRAFAV